MLTTKKYIILSATSFIAGILFCALYNQWIIIQLPSFSPRSTQSSAINRKKIVLHYFHNDKWKTETQEHLWSENTPKNISQLVNAFLTLLNEEKIIGKKTTLQSVLLSKSGTAYLSFDHNIFSKEDTIFKKWMILEGLLNTIRTNTISIQNVQFLVQHQQLNDPHLDFSMPWPIEGFMK